MRILVTGGAGFIGTNLVRRLSRQGHEVAVFDDLSVGRRENLAGLTVEFIAGDVLDLSAVRLAVRDREAIVHLAAQTGVPGSLEDPRRDCEVNVLGTLNMLEAARQAEVRRVVFASSNAPLGRQSPPADPDKAPLPVSPYGASKLAGEGYCLAYHGSWGLGTVVLRFANVYGPRSEHKASVVARFFKDILDKRRITLDGDGSQTRDFLFVEDLCRAVELSLDSDLAGEVLQVATGMETAIRDLAERVINITGHDVRVETGPARRGDVQRNYSSIAKIEALLGWRPEVSLDDGLERTWTWLIERAT